MGLKMRIRPWVLPIYVVILSIFGSHTLAAAALTLMRGRSIKMSYGPHTKEYRSNRKKKKKKKKKKKISVLLLMKIIELIIYQIFPLLSSSLLFQSAGQLVMSPVPLSALRTRLKKPTFEIDPSDKLSECQIPSPAGAAEPNLMAGCIHEDLLGQPGEQSIPSQEHRLECEGGVSFRVLDSGSEPQLCSSVQDGFQAEEGQEVSNTADENPKYDETTSVRRAFWTRRR